MIAVSNSTPPLYLAKLNKLTLLKKNFEKIIIPKEVYDEIVIRGREMNREEVYFLEREINEGFIIVKEIKKIKKVEQLHEGEAKAISLCVKSKEKNILLVREKLINFDEFKRLLIRLSEEGYFFTIEYSKE